MRVGLGRGGWRQRVEEGGEAIRVGAVLSIFGSCLRHFLGLGLFDGGGIDGVVGGGVVGGGVVGGGVVGGSVGGGLGSCGGGGVSFGGGGEVIGVGVSE
eukprot:2780847-Pleurochrysis_carterae.AAC.2